MTDKSNQMTLTTKIAIKPTNTDFSSMRHIFKDIQLEVSNVVERKVFETWAHKSYLKLNKEFHNNKLTKNDFEIEGAPTIGAYITRINKLKYQNSDKTIIEQAERDGESKYKTRKEKNGVLDGVLPHFSENQPIPLKYNSFRLYEEDGKYYMTARMLTKPYAEKLYKGVKLTKTVNGKKKTIQYYKNDNSQWMTFELIVKGKDKRNKDIMSKLMSDEYGQGSSKILRKSGDYKWFFALSYNFIPKEEEVLDEYKIMGVDLGIKKPAYMAFNFNDDKRHYIDNKELDHFRKKVQARRNDMLRQGKYCGDGRRGHGRKTKLKPIEKLNGKVENFKNTTNHKYARYIVDLAVKNECKTIQMEDLSGISSGDKKSSYLGNWTYFDLQTKIEYKAKVAGVNFVKVKPYKTSQRCHACGFIAKGSRNIEKNGQEHFECLKCERVFNSDYNAAKNLSEYGIEEKIKEQVKKQEQDIKNNMKYVAE